METTITLTVGQITGLNTAPVELLAAEPGIFKLPTRAIFKRTGDRYATQPGALQIRYVTSAPFAHMSANAAGGILLGQNRWGCFGGGAGQYGLDDSAVGLSGKAVQLFAANGNPAVDATFQGSDVELTLVWEEYEV